MVRLFSSLLFTGAGSVKELVISEMTKACINGFKNIHRASVPFPKGQKCRIVLVRTLYTCAAASIPPIISLVYRPRSSLTAPLDASNAPLQRSDEWFVLRKDKLTTSTFSTALGFWKGNRRCELWQEKVFELDDQTINASTKHAMEWGVTKESTAIERYKSITGHKVGSLGFATHSEARFQWLGASPDGLLEYFSESGILEVKCPFNKGKPETALPWTKMPFYYMPQLQGQMEIMDRDWVDLYCWTPNGSTLFRVCRDRGYWELIHDILREFWWENVVPAREALLMGKEDEAMSFKPTPIHTKTGLVISRSLKLSNDAKLSWREIAGHVEFY